MTLNLTVGSTGCMGADKYCGPTDVGLGFLLVHHGRHHVGVDAIWQGGQGVIWPVA